MNLSQKINQAVFQLLEELDQDNQYCSGSQAAPLVERIAQLIIRELPEDLKNPVPNL